MTPFTLALACLLSLDGGTPAAPVPTPRVLSAEDEEVVRLLDLLENLDSAESMELLEELAVER